MKPITQKDLRRLADYLIDIANGYDDEDEIELSREELERELYYNPSKEI